MVRVPFASRNKAAQTLVDIKAPCVRTTTVAFERRNQSDVRKAEFRLALLTGDLKHDVSAVPLGWIFDEVDVAVHHMPCDVLAWHPLGNPLSGVVKVFVTVPELSTELVGTTVDFS